MSHISTDLSTEKKPPDVTKLGTEKWEHFDRFMRKKTSYFFSAKKNARDFGIHAQVRKTVLAVLASKPGLHKTQNIKQKQKNV